MPIHLEELLLSAAQCVRGDRSLPPAVFARLQFLARVLQLAPTGNCGGALLLWLNERGGLASVSVPDRGVMIGRSPACDLVLASPRLSRRHAVVHVGRGGPSEMMIEDLNSSNGTYVNGRPVSATPHPLKDGDVIEVGGIPVAFLSGNPVH